MSTSKPSASPAIRRKKRPISEAKTSPAALLLHCLMGTGAAMIAALFLSLLGGALCLLAEDPNTLIRPVGTVILYLSALLGGFVTLRFHGGGILPCGGLCGGFLLVILRLLALLFEKDGSGVPFPLSLLLMLLIPVFSVIGARLGIKHSHPKKRRKRS